MHSPAINLASKFSGHLRNLEYTRAKMERLFAGGEIVSRDINQVYVGLYLEVITSFEGFIEKLFVGLLTGTYTVSTQPVVPLVAFRNRRAVEPIMLQQRRYLDWLPYENTVRRAKQFFRNGVPFSSMAEKDKELIQQCMYIRHAIVHKSNYSFKRFNDHVLGNQNLMSWERKPAGYLRSVLQTGPNKSRYEYFAQEISSIGMKLCS